MSTHGDILVIDEGATQGQWLHAYSDGHSKDAYKMLKTLPELFAKRVELAIKLDDPSIGKGWFIKQWNPRHWSDGLSVSCEAWSGTIAGLIVQSYFNRWLPMHEDQAPWHEVGDRPDFTVVCNGHGYKVIGKGFKPVSIDFQDRVFELIDAIAKQQK
jgi:hypothetical protein